MNNRVIFHIDINCFFCRCEETVNPKLEFVPFVVSEKSRKGIVCSSNILARKSNIKAPMLIAKALELEPKLIVIEPHFDLYELKSLQFKECIRKFYTNEIESMSIDECFIDVTDILENHHNNIDILAQNILNTIYKETGLHATIGIGNTKFLAKMAGDTKPLNKIAKIFSWEVEEKIWPLELSKLYGAGNVTVQFLSKLGIKTIYDFLSYEDQESLENHLKSRYSYLRSSCLGVGNDMINLEPSKTTTISRGRSFGASLTEKKEIYVALEILCNSLCEELVNYNLVTRNLHIKVKFDSSEPEGKSFKLNKYTFNANDILTCFKNMFEKMWNGDPIKAITLSVNGLKSYNDINKQLKIDLND
ncbi:MAG: Y-family DNA polymerase [Mycoplasma sp.]